MRTGIYIILILFFSLAADAQDSLFKKKQLTAIDVELFYAFYTQDGDHSAVTGGTGTEKLHVHSTGFNFGLTTDTSHTVLLEASIDAITSASTDRIDFVVSSASYHDNHFDLQLGYRFDAKKIPFIIGGKYLFGLESDFTSHGFNIWSALAANDQTREISVSLVCYFGDLRWLNRSEGRGFHRTTLIYPVELRYKQWFNIYKRNTYNLSLSMRQDVSRRFSVTADAGFIMQKGLLSTPYHRVYFADSDSIKVENLPQSRLQIPLGVGFNAFLLKGLILKVYYRYYRDDFGIRAHALGVETPVKFGYQYTLYPFFRIYHQTASTFFKPYKGHALADQYYTSDYDLSAFWSYKLGIGFGFYPDKRLGRNNWSFNQVMMRYAYYYRTDFLQAHMLSVSFMVGKE